jgi:hypothetical protein
VVGLVLAIAPWIGGYAGDGAAVSWIGGVALMVLAGAAYRRRGRRGDRNRRIRPLPNQASMASHCDATKVPTEPVDSADFDQPQELVDATFGPDRCGY